MVPCPFLAKEDTVLAKKGQVIKGHEFHHSIFDSEEPCAYEMTKERNGVVIDRWDGGYSSGGVDLTNDKSIQVSIDKFNKLLVELEKLTNN